MSEALGRRLREAIASEQFVVHYLPKFDLATGALCGLEALLRWEDPEHGLVGPEAFLPALENSDLIVEVGNWTVRHALSQRLAWHIAGLRPPRVSVNVSQSQLRHPDFVASLCDSLRTVGVGAPGLEIELSESLLEDLNGDGEKLRAIGERGIGIAIDDCGGGYASFERLADLPVSELKVDRPRIAGMASDGGDRAAVSSVITLARALNVTVVAEGVETEQQRELLRGMKCDRIQGYIASKPLPAARIASLLARDEEKQ